ncbi:hypothetical protein VKT23_006558 [Stygiomarasmius scandens]|uniref:Uncharacterized protein n=1 Tax=Marasmiellus scandens TaxID=2682957 RepID=A0ABR1JPH6_9AGAR
MLVSPMADILEQIYSGVNAEHLLYESRNLSDWRVVPARVRNVYIARICRALCLSGYNLNVKGIREEILKTLVSLYREERSFSSHYSRYVQAADWDSLSTAVRRSIAANEMDEMVQILHQSRVSGRIHPIVGVRQIIYNKIEDLPVILGDDVVRSQHTLNASQSKLNPSAAIFVPKFNARGQQDVAAAEESESADDEQVEDVAVQILPSAPLPASEEFKISEPTEEEHQAASLIQSTYRTYSSLKAKRQSKSQHAEIRDNFWQQCMDRLDCVPKGEYRTMLLGPLPHVWAVLEFMNARTLDRKHETKKQMNRDLKDLLKREEWDRLDKELTAISGAFKKIKTLQTSLNVQSNVHSSQDLHRLRQLISDVRRCIEEDLPFQLPSEMKHEFDISHKYIVEEHAKKAVGRKPIRPKLNTSDILEM